MEFLAESIGLLDLLDEGGGGQLQQQNNNDEAVESNTNVLSFLNFSSWTGGGGGDASVGSHNINNTQTEEGEGSESTSAAEIPHLMKERAQSDALSSEQKIATQLGDKEEDGEEEELGASNLSLLSSLTPASPLTMSASSLNLLSSMNLMSSSIDVTKSEHRFSGLDRIDDLDTAYQDGLDRNTVPLPQKNDIAHENDRNKQPTKDKEQTTSIQVRARRKTLDRNILTKHVTQRIDARTNYDCFTGEVDALTGHIIHGKMVYRQTGTVYEGPFITKFIPPQRRRSVNTNINIQSSVSRQGNEEREEDITTCDTISLRHGINATCEWSNGMIFVGSWEYDHPISGKFTGLDWTYEGPLLVVKEGGIDNDDDDDDVTHLQKNNIDQRRYGSSLEALPSLPSSVGSDMSSNLVRCIGIPHPLPGSVVFHGKGLFTRSDGLVYKGEFQNGLANGVGKETLSNGQVYSGEFVDGLRHGVGTLMEDHPDSDGRCDCDCKSQEGGQDKVNGDTLDDGTDTDRITAARRGNRVTANNTDNGPSVDPGPDAAAGGTSSHSTNNILPENTTTTTKQGAGCNCKVKSTKAKTRRRYSSGVWCAGRFEIEDSRGSVHSNEFIEESSTTVAASTEAGDNKKQSEDKFKQRASLTRTTWDMLDEKWLGISNV